MILRIVEAVVCGSHLMRLAFNDGARKAVESARFSLAPCSSRCEIRTTSRTCDWTPYAEPWYGLTVPILHLRR
jgi:hypothetical protein